MTDVYGIKSDKKINTLLGNIRKGGAMEKLISDIDLVEISKRVHDIM